jgi:hypothetical protein
MTSDEVYKLIEANGLTLHGDIEHFAALVASAEREACAEIADRLPRIYRETEEAHHRLSPEPFKPSNFGFDFAELKQAEAITHAIRARGQA